MQCLQLASRYIVVVPCVYSVGIFDSGVQLQVVFKQTLACVQTQVNSKHFDTTLEYCLVTKNVLIKQTFSQKLQYISDNKVSDSGCVSLWLFCG